MLNVGQCLMGLLFKAENDCGNIVRPLNCSASHSFLSNKVHCVVFQRGGGD